MLAFIFLFVALAFAYPNRGPCTGDCWTHDPAMLQRHSDGKYFRFATANGINIMSSDSVKGPWKDIGAALPEGTSIKIDGVDKKNLWAPDVHFQGDTYYMYYVISQIGTRNSEIGVASSKTMEPGSWTDHGAVGIPANDAWNKIDPNWISIGGKQYLQFGSFWNDIHQVPMKGPLKVDSTAPHQLAFNETLNHRLEGAFMFQHDDFYYLLFTSGIAGKYTENFPDPGEEYAIRVCRSKTGTGEFVDQNGTDCRKTGGNLLLASHGQVFGPGGPGIVNDKDLGVVMYYHYYPLAEKQAGGKKGTDAYMYAWNALGWEKGWPFVKA